jgi:hypothetical protein
MRAVSCIPTGPLSQKLELPWNARCLLDVLRLTSDALFFAFASLRTCTFVYTWSLDSQLAWRPMTLFNWTWKRTSHVKSLPVDSRHIERLGLSSRVLACESGWYDRTRSRAWLLKALTGLFQSRLLEPHIPTDDRYRDSTVPQPLLLLMHMHTQTGIVHGLGLDRGSLPTNPSTQRRRWFKYARQWHLTNLPANVAWAKINIQLQGRLPIYSHQLYVIEISGYTASNPVATFRQDDTTMETCISVPNYDLPWTNSPHSMPTKDTTAERGCKCKSSVAQANTPKYNHLGNEDKHKHRRCHSQPHSKP